jgi:hypothetical protein
MFRRLVPSLAVLALAAGAANAHAALIAGDVMFTSFNADEDGWSMVALANIDANTTIYFSDNEWNGSAFNTGESFTQWATGGSTIGAGTVIRFSAVDNATTLAASVGTLSRATVSGSANWGLSQSADTVYAYLGSSASTPTQFLAAISSGLFSAAEGPLAGTGLTAGTNAIALSNSSDYAEYNGSRSGAATFGDYRAQLANIANWNDLGDGTYAGNVPNTTSFTVAPVPLPAAAWLTISGLASLAGFARRRRTDATAQAATSAAIPA